MMARSGASWAAAVLVAVVLLACGNSARGRKLKQQYPSQFASQQNSVSRTFASPPPAIGMACDASQFTLLVLSQNVVSSPLVGANLPACTTVPGQQFTLPSRLEGQCITANNGRDYFISFDTVGQCLDGSSVISTSSYTIQALLSQTADGAITVQSVAVTAGPSQQQQVNSADVPIGNTRALDLGSDTRAVNFQVRANGNSDGLSEDRDDEGSDDDNEDDSEDDSDDSDDDSEDDTDDDSEDDSDDDSEDDSDDDSEDDSDDDSEDDSDDDSEDDSDDDSEDDSDDDSEDDNDTRAGGDDDSDSDDDSSEEDDSEESEEDSSEDDGSTRAGDDSEESDEDDSDEDSEESEDSSDVSSDESDGSENRAGGDDSECDGAVRCNSEESSDADRSQDKDDNDNDEDSSSQSDSDSNGTLRVRDSASDSDSDGTITGGTSSDANSVDDDDAGVDISENGDTEAQEV